MRIWLLPITAFLMAGCSLLPYDSEFSCGVSEGYGTCLSARENYRLSMMSDEERDRALTGKKSENSATGAEDDYWHTSSQKQNKAAPQNEEDCCSMAYLQRLVLDRQTLERRTSANDANITIERISTVNADEKMVVNEGAFCEVCNDGDGYPPIAPGSTVTIAVESAWLRTSPNPDFPPKNGIEAKRGEKFVARGSSRGWVELENGRFIHQSIVKVED